MIDSLNLWMFLQENPGGYAVVILFSIVIILMNWLLVSSNDQLANVLFYTLCAIDVFGLLVAASSIKVGFDMQTDLVYLVMIPYLIVGALLSRLEWLAFADTRFNKVLFVRNEYLQARDLSVYDLKNNGLSSHHIHNLWFQLSDAFNIDRSNHSARTWEDVLEVLTPKPSEIGGRLFVVILWWPVIYVIRGCRLAFTSSWQFVRGKVNNAYLKDVKSKFEEL